MKQSVVQKAKLYLQGIAVTTSSMCAAEAFQQKQFRKYKHFNWTELRDVALVSSFWVAPWNCTWVIVVLPAIWKGPRQFKYGEKVLAGLALTPVMQSVFFGAFCWLQGEKNMKEVVFQKTMTSWPCAIVFWAPIMYVNLRYVPLHLQVPFMSLCQLFWSNVLVMIKAEQGGLPDTLRLPPRTLIQSHALDDDPHDFLMAHLGI